MYKIKEGNKYYVYMHVFPNYKVYIGITSQEKPEDRWLSGYGYKAQARVWRAIKKYGWDNIEHIVVAKNVNIETALNMEIDLIRLYNSDKKDNGYNTSPGGWIMSESSKELLSDRRKGQKLSEETKSKISATLSGRKPSEKAIEYIKQYNKTRDYSAMKQPNEKEILQYSVSTGEFIKEYKSINAASTHSEVDVRNISGCIKEVTGHAGGYVWFEKRTATADYIEKRIFNAQNPQRFCPCSICYSDTGRTKYYRTLKDLCLEENISYKYVSKVLKDKKSALINSYRINKISIPEYIQNTGKKYFA